VVTCLDAGHRDGCERHRPLPDPRRERFRREQRGELRREHVRGVAAPVRVVVQAVKDPVEAVGGRTRNQVPHKASRVGSLRSEKTKALSRTDLS